MMLYYLALYLSYLSLMALFYLSFSVLAYEWLYFVACWPLNTLLQTATFYLVFASQFFPTTALFDRTLLLRAFLLTALFYLSFICLSVLSYKRPYFISYLQLRTFLSMVLLISHICPYIFLPMVFILSLVVLRAYFYFISRFPLSTLTVIS